MPYNGVEWLIKNKTPLIDAEYTINVDAGGGEIENGKHTLFDVQAAEKVFHSVSLTAKNPGGHSSLPRKDNAIYALAAALEPRRRVRFPGEAERRREGVLHARPRPTATPRSPPTCEAVARGNRDAGRDRAAEQDAALQRADAHDVRRDDARGRPRAERAAADGDGDGELPHAPRRRSGGRREDARPRDQRHVGPSRADRHRDAESRVAAAAGSVHGRRGVGEGDLGTVPIVPIMETGATDGLYLRNAGVPVYGFSGLFIAIDDVRAHGKDERILVTAFDDALDFTYDFLKRIAR